jgi:hypothetical protein
LVSWATAEVCHALYAPEWAVYEGMSRFAIKVGAEKLQWEYKYKEYKDEDWNKRQDRPQPSDRWVKNVKSMATLSRKDKTELIKWIADSIKK